MASHKTSPINAVIAPIPDDLPEEVVKTIQAAVVTGFQALHLRDYARFDFRITLDHKAYLIEANPNPYLYSGAEFVKAARASGAAPAPKRFWKSSS